MDWMLYAKPPLLSALLTRCFRKRIIRHVIGYLALVCLLVYAEIKTGFLAGRVCQNGAFLTYYATNETVASGQQRSHQQNFSDLPTAPSPTVATRFKLSLPGGSIEMVRSRLFLPTAVRYWDFPKKDDFTILLHGWAPGHSDPRFSCCLLRTLNDENRDIVRAKGIRHKENSFNSSLEDNEIRSTEFYCSLSKRDIVATNHIADFKYVTFTEGDSCGDVDGGDDVLSRDVIKIESHERIFRSVGLCVSLPSSINNAEYFVEWLEWYRMQGTTETYIYYDHDLSKAFQRIFEYYSMVGYLRPVRMRQPIYHFNGDRPLFDGDMASNDCRHRMSLFDYVITAEVHEVMAPTSFGVTLYDILKDASRQFPQAASFQLHSYQVILDWRPSKKSPLHMARHELRSDHINMGEDERLSRWAYIPHRTDQSYKRIAVPKQPYTRVAVSRSSYAFLRFVRCHPRIMTDCKLSRSKVKDKAISRFQNSLIMSIRETPIDYILPYNTKYVAMFHKIRIPGDSYYIGGA